MPELVWDKLVDRKYETGLDKGVLYLPDGSGVPWNGLTAIIEKFDKESTPVYYEGTKISDLISVGSFAASMKAVTYPEEFVELEGLAPARPGLFYGDQQPQAFGLCYRTQIGNALEGEVEGYKIHILCNVTAIPSEKTYATLTADPSLVEFEWEISAVPEDVPGFRPTAHIVLDTRDLDPWLLEDLERMLYGSSVAEASLLSMSALVTFINGWYRIQIIDNGDGTWTAITQRDGFISFGPEEYFEIVNANAIYLNETTFVISDTADISDIPQIVITEFEDGTWTASTEHDNLIVMTGEYEFEIRNANVVYLNGYTYQISDTAEE